MSRAGGQAIRDAIFMLAEIAGSKSPAVASELRQRCGLSASSLKRTVSLLSSLGLIQRVPGRSTAYLPANRAGKLRIGEVLDLLSQHTKDSASRGAVGSLEGLNGCITVAQLSAAMRSLESQLCPYLDLCNALQGLDERMAGDSCPWCQA